jgi:hypothetical protein
MMTSEAERDTSCDQDIGSPRQVIATSALLKEFPWNSGVVFHQEPWLGFFQESPWVQVNTLYQGPTVFSSFISEILVPYA